MSTTLDRVVGVVAPRLADLLAEGETAILHAPHEFAPVEIAEAALELLDTGEPRDRFDVREAGDVLRLMPLLVRRKPIFLIWDEHLAMEQGAVGRLVSQIVDSAGVMPPVLAVVELDIAVPEVYVPFDLNLSQSALTLTPAEIVEVGGGEISPLVARRIHQATGGVPRLVAAAIEDALSIGPGVITAAARPPSAGLAATTDNDSDDGELVQVSRAWAERLLPQYVDDELMLLHAWLIPLHARGLAALATSVLGRPVSPAEVRQCHDAGAFVSTAAGLPRALPTTLARALATAATENDALAARAIRRAVSHAAADERIELTPLERIWLLTSISAWASLDRVLGRAMVHLALLSGAQLAELSTYWPEQVPQEWGHLAAATTFVDGSWLTGRRQLPLPWLELMHLITAEDPAARGEDAEAVLDRLIRGVGQAQSPDIGEVRAAVADGHALLRRLASESHRALADPAVAPTLSRPKAALVCYALLGQADAYLSIARLTLAQECVNEATALAGAASLDAHVASSLMAGLTARSAVLSAKAGVHDRAAHFLAQYEDVVAVTASRDPEPEQIISISRRYRDDWRRLGDDAIDVLEPSDVEIDVAPQYLPLEVEAEGLSLLLARGPVVASQWLKAFLARARWVNLLSWEWWPLHATLAMIEVRQGNTEAAQRWVDGGTLPESMSLVVRAGIELSSGDAEGANQLADRAAAFPDTPDRWRLAAYGLKLATMAATRDLENGTELLARLPQWRTSLSVVALLPAAGRRVILAELGDEYADVPGLRLDDAAPVRREPAEIELTPRQMDVLRGLEAGKTASEIADDLVLGRETIRTTTKALYKRLGVHSKASALQVARSVGLI